MGGLKLFRASARFVTVSGRASGVNLTFATTSPRVPGVNVEFKTRPATNIGQRCLILAFKPKDRLFTSASGRIHSDAAALAPPFATPTSAGRNTRSPIM
jgi:hypothetical protein